MEERDARIVAEERASQAEKHAMQAEKRAYQAEERTSQAEERALQAEKDRAALAEELKRLKSRKDGTP